jgi:predicted phage terminase large subunit-like protein
MPPTNRLPPITAVSQSELDRIEQEILIRARILAASSTRVYDEELGADADEAEAKLAEMQTNIGAYGDYVFGWKPEPFHTYWNDAAEDVIRRRIPQNKLLIIAPPNSAKSSWNSIVRPCHYLGQHPDQSLIFITASDSMAGNFGSTVRAALDGNPKHRAVFPDPLTRPSKTRGWSGDGLYLRGTPAGTKDPAYKSVSLNTNIMGSRANGIILDDPLDQKAAVSAAEQRRAKDYYDQTIVPRLQPVTGWLIAIMTRFHEADLASHFIRLSEEAKDWLVIRTPQIAQEGHTDPMGRKPGDLLWPSRITEAYVEAEQRRMGTAEFNLVHQGDPTGIGGDVFREEGWFQPLPLDFWGKIFPTCRTVQAWDLAFSENKRACYTVGVTVAIDRDFNLYLLNVVRKRMTIMETEQTLVKLIKLLRPLVIGIEESRFHQELTRAMVRRVLGQVMCNIQLVRPDADKTARAMLPAARAEAGKVFVNRDAVWYRTFMQECLGFPNTRYKDQVDAFSLAAFLVERLSEMKSRDAVTYAETVMA